MKKLIKNFIFIITSIFLCLLGNMNAYAGTIEIDGKYDDWNIDEMDSIDDTGYKLLFNMIQEVNFYDI